MKVNRIGNDVPPLDVFSTFFPLYSVLHVLGLSSVYRDKGEIKFSPLLWKSCLIFFLLIIGPLANVICCYMRICVGSTDGTFTTIVTMFHLVGNVQYLVDVYHVHKYGKESFIDYMSVYKYIDKSLGGICYKKIKTSIRKICLFVLVISLFVFIFNSISCFISLGGIIAAVNVLEYFFYFFKVLNALDMISNAIQVKYRLKVIADLLKDYYNHLDYMSGVVQNVSFKVFVTNNHSDTPKEASIKRVTIMEISRCYLLLIKQCNYINNMYGFRIFLHNLIFVIDLVTILNLMIRLIFGSLVIKYSWLPIIATAAGLLALCTVCYCGVHCCEQSYRQTQRITFWIESLLLKRELSPDVKDALKELNNLVQLKPISFHVLHFYKVEYVGLKSIASAVVTYTIIFLQNVT